MEENKKKRKEPKLATKLLNIKHQKIVEEKDNVDLNKPVKITLSRKVRWFLFSILIYLTLVMDLDQGILSSTTDSISKDLELNSNELGGLGSMVFLGKSLGCLLFFTLINQLNRKYMLLINTVFLIFSLILTTQTKKLMLLYISRIIAGLTQSYLSIYLPVWTDQFGIHKHKSMMMACNHLASSLGSLFGYVFGYSFGWKLGFYIQNILIMIPVVIIIFIKNKFFSMSLMPVKSKMKLADIVEDKENKESDKLEKEKSKEEKEEKKEDPNNLKDDISLFEDIQKNGEGNTQGSIKLQILSIIKSPIFILINITLCSIYIIVAAVQFWINDYLQNNLKIEDAGSRLAMFGGVVLTAFPIGMIVGGIALTKIGGYESEKAIYIPLVFSLITSIFANLAPLSSNVYIFLPLFWIFFFAGSAIIPAANTISLVSVEKKFAGAASSTSILIYNVLGRFPGPNIYASFKSLINDNKSRIPMLLLLNISFIGFIATLIALKFNKQKFIKLREELLKKEKEEKEKDNNDNIEEEEILKIDEDNENNKENKIEENENKEVEEEGEEKENNIIKLM